LRARKEVKIKAIRFKTNFLAFPIIIIFNPSHHHSTILYTQIIMLNSFCKSIFRKNNSNPLQINAPAYTFILGRMFKNKATEEDAKKEQEMAKR
jgi:hypothetical protein